MPAIVLTRADRQTARYTPAGGRERCAQCRFFMPADKCGRIVGPVSPSGWCKYYSLQVSQRWQPGVVPAQGGPSLSLDFMQPGALNPRITFTRASTATYFDATGTMQTAAVNAPRWDYDPVTHALRGLLIEEARTNLTVNSGDLSNATWTTSGTGPPVITGHLVTAPDGTVTGTRLAYPATNFGTVAPPAITVTAAVYGFSVWLRGTVGGEQLYLSTTPDGALYYRQLVTLSTAWQRFTLITGTLTAVPWYFVIGVDNRDASQTPKSAQTVYAWGAQLEQGAFPTSHIPTTAAAVTRAIDVCEILPASMGWFVPPGGSWAAEFIDLCPAAYGNVRVIGNLTGPGQTSPMYLGVNTLTLGQWPGGAVIASANAVTIGAVSKGATSFDGSTGRACLNAGAIASGATTGGYSALSSVGAGILEVQPAASSENMTGYIRRVQYWPRVLSDAEMQAVTT